PQSTARTSSPVSRTIMLRPISPRPPRGTIRTAGSMEDARGGSGEGTPEGSPADSVIPPRMVSRGLGAAQKAGDPRELLEIEALRAAPAIHAGQPQRAGDTLPREGGAKRVGESLPPLGERHLDDAPEARGVVDRHPRARAEDGPDHRRRH